MDKVTDIRLSCHQLVEPAFERPADLVNWMGAVQAQDYTMAKWAVGMRLKNGLLTTVNEALRTGEVIRTHVMRPTWHFVARKDIHWMLQLSAQRVKKSIDQWTKKSGLDISERLYTRCNDLMAKMLEGRQHKTKEEMAIVLEQAGVEVTNDRMRRYLLRAELEGIICSGEDRAGKPTYALLAEQAPHKESFSREEALAKLAGHYFRSHAPAGLKDFVWWSGLTTTEAKQAIAMIRQQLESVHFDSLECWLPKSCKEVKGEVHFLPGYDEYLLGYKERQTVLNPQHYSKAFNKWGIFYPVILYKGRVSGNWKKEKRKGELTIETAFFESCSRLTDCMVRRAEERYRTFCGSENN